MKMQVSYELDDNGHEFGLMSTVHLSSRLMYLARASSSTRGGTDGSEGTYGKESVVRSIAVPAWNKL